MKTQFLSLLLFTALLYACSPATPAETSAPTADVAAEPTGPNAGRIASAEERLSTTPAGELVLSTINAHGGLERWYNQGALAYRFNYRPVEADKTVRDSRILNDYVNARAVHTSMTQEGMTYGFDGNQAWKHPAGAELEIKPRFWSLTPYYFVGLPFVLADEGINFELLPERMWGDISYQRVKVTYAEGTGDADQDYYVLWIDPFTGEMDALNYIVSYPGFFPDGGHLPEKFMVISGKTKVDGVTLPTGYTTRWSDKPEEVITNITVSDYAFRPEMTDGDFTMPQGAEVVSDLPK